MIRFVKQSDAAVAPDGVKDCIGHRCDEHERAEPHNANGPDQSECAMCLVEAFVLAYERQFEAAVFWPAITSARDRLNLLLPGAGNDLLEDARATLNAAALDQHAGEDRVEFARRVAIECGADADEVEAVLRRLT
jgi:hypothetical protein